MMNTLENALRTLIPGSSALAVSASRSEPWICSLSVHVRRPHTRSSYSNGTSRVGKPGDFLFQSSDQEAGVGENTRPKYKEHHDKSKTDFINVIKVARAQHLHLRTRMTELSGSNPAPENLQEAVALISIPFFHVGMRIRFYLLFQVSGDLYGILEWASEDLPVKDAAIVLLCKRFLVHKNLVNEVGRMLDALIKKAKVLRGEATSI